MIPAFRDVEKKLCLHPFHSCVPFILEGPARRGGGEAAAQVAAQIGMEEALHVDERVDLSLIHI